MSTRLPSDRTARDLDPEDTQHAVELLGSLALTRGQVIHAAVKLGVVERLGDEPVDVEVLAGDLDLDPAATRRLCRALAVYGVLEAHADGGYSLTPVGRHYREEHPASMRDVVLYGLGPERRLASRHLPDIVAEGGPNGYEREFGCSFFEYCERNPSFGEHFNGTQQLLTSRVTPAVLDGLDAFDFGRFETVCDVGGGHGYLLSHLLDAEPGLEGTVLELPSVVAEADRHWAAELGVEDRCTYAAGDMFEAVPAADLYLMKYILHDWTDDECVEILSTTAASAPAGARLLVVESVVDAEDPSPEAVDLDMVMLMETTGRERTEAEYRSLLAAAGWDLLEVWGTEQHVSVIEASVA